MSEIKVTKENFEQEVINSDVPVLVDFWATWCGPCMMLAPIVEELAQDLEGKVKVAKINVDEEPELAIQYKIVSIPTLLLFENGEVIKKSMGYLEKEQLMNIFGF